MIPLADAVNNVMETLSRRLRRSLFPYLGKAVRPKQPEIDRLEVELRQCRTAHRPTRPILMKMRDARLTQLRKEVSNDRL